jgi:hypothetical protein
MDPETVQLGKYIINKFSENKNYIELTDKKLYRID